MIRTTLLAAGLSAALLLGSSPMALSRTLEGLTDQNVEMLAAYLAGDTPNFREEALKSYDYRRANEFDKPTVLNQIESKLRAEYEGMGDVEAIRLRIGANIGQYDAAEGVFRIDSFAPGVFFRFGRQSLVFDNAPDLYEWEIPVAEARKVREISRNGHVTIELLLRPFGVSPNDQSQIRTQIIGMTMMERNSGQALREVALAPSEYRPILSAKDAIPTRVDDAKLSVAGLTLGMTQDEVRATLGDQGLMVFDKFDKAIRFATTDADPYAGTRLGNNAHRTTLDGFNRLAAITAMIFGKELDCMDSARVHSCGIARFNTEGEVISIAYLQNAVNTSKQEIVTALFARYGTANDRFEDYVFRTHVADQYVWGQFAEGDAVIPAHKFTKISGPKHWQIEAYIAEPSTERKAVIVQINSIAPIPAPQAAVVGSSSEVSSVGPLAVSSFRRFEQTNERNSQQAKSPTCENPTPSDLPKTLTLPRSGFNKNDHDQPSSAKEIAMSTNSNDPHRNGQGQLTQQGSRNQGAHEARTSGIATPQQSGESNQAYQTRMKSFTDNKK